MARESVVSGEAVVTIACAGEELVGILHLPEHPAALGVVVVVGGPQYRVGSHRQFVLLARYLAARGYPVLRFDCRGMGDSDGQFPGFENIGPDIAAAIDTLWTRVALRGVVLWGLCDAASAIMMYAAGDERVAGAVLLNPWVRSEATIARTYLRHYYVTRLTSMGFWRDLLRGRLRTGRALGDLADNLRAGGRAGGQPGFVARMQNGLRDFHGEVALILSANDLTAAEFLEVAGTPPWRQVLARPGISRHTIAGANHTFASEMWRNEVAAHTLALLRSVESAWPSAT